MMRLLIYFVLAVLAAATGHAAAPKDTVTIGYFESGSYYLQKVMLNEIHERLGIMAGDSIAVEYSPDAYYSAGWNRELCRTMARDLTRQRGIDLVIAAGPWVVEDLLAAGMQKPIVAIYQFDPELIGLVDAAGIPVAPNLTVSYAPRKIEKDIKSLLQIFPSVRRLGVLYFPSGDEFEKVRDEVYEHAGKAGVIIQAGKEIAREGNYSFFLSFQKISRQIDALYLPPLWGLELEQMRQFLYETQAAKVPTFSAEGFLILEKDATAAGCLWPYRSMARFTAAKILKIAGGARPASLPTRLEETEEFALNLEAANKLGIIFPRRLLNESRTLPALPGDSITRYTLPQAMAQAMAEYPGVLAHDAAYDRALAAAQSAWQSYYPEINLDLSAATADNGSTAALYDPRLNRKFAATASLEQTIFSLPALKEIALARKEIDLENNERQRARLDLKTAVTLAYLDVLEKEDLLAAQLETWDKGRDLRAFEEYRLKVGSGDRGALAAVDERLIEIRQKSIMLEAEHKVARAVFNSLLNRPAEYNFILDRAEFSPEIMAAMVRKLEEYVVNTPVEKKFERYLIDYGIGHSFALNRADLARGIKRDMMAVGKSRFWPELKLRAAYSYGRQFRPAFDDRDEYWVLGGMATFSLFPGNSRYNGRVLQAEIDRQLYDKDEQRFAHQNRILNRKSELVSLLTRLPLDYSLQNLAVENLKNARLQYEEGRETLAELMAREGRSAQFTTATINNRYRFFATYAGLLHEIGVGYMMHGSPEEISFYRDLEEFLRK